MHFDAILVIVFTEITPDCRVNCQVRDLEFIIVLQEFQGMAPQLARVPQQVNQREQGEKTCREFLGSRCLKD